MCVLFLLQTRYLKFRKWPVEWGWCRDLQSFIFVFERHNRCLICLKFHLFGPFFSSHYITWCLLWAELQCRIVLERPEYGYATYFFELVESLPVEWQLKRLVIAMKLTTCSRISIIENKELVVMVLLICLVFMVLLLMRHLFELPLSSLFLCIGLVL